FEVRISGWTWMPGTSPGMTAVCRITQDQTSKPPSVPHLFAISIDGESEDGVAALRIDLRVAARADNDELLGADHVGGRRRVDAGAGVERPEDLAAGGIIGLELAVCFAGEHQAAGGRQRAADHRL